MKSALYLSGLVLREHEPHVLAIANQPQLRIMHLTDLYTPVSRTWYAHRTEDFSDERDAEERETLVQDAYELLLAAILHARFTRFDRPFDPQHRAIVAASIRYELRQWPGMIAGGRAFSQCASFVGDWKDQKDERKWHGIVDNLWNLEANNSWGRLGTLATYIERTPELVPFRAVHNAVHGRPDDAPIPECLEDEEGPSEKEDFYELVDQCCHDHFAMWLRDRKRVEMDEQMDDDREERRQARYAEARTGEGETPYPDDDVLTDEDF